MGLGFLLPKENHLSKRFPNDTWGGEWVASEDPAGGRRPGGGAAPAGVPGARGTGAALCPGLGRDLVTSGL